MENCFKIRAFLLPDENEKGRFVRRTQDRR